MLGVMKDIDAIIISLVLAPSVFLPFEYIMRLSKIFPFDAMRSSLVRSLA